VLRSTPGGTPPAPPADEHTRVETAAQRTGPGGLRLRIAELRDLGLLGVLALLILAGSLTRPAEFLAYDNVVVILTLASVSSVITVGMTFVIIGGGIDLSVGAIVALATVWATTRATQVYGTGGVVFCALARRRPEDHRGLERRGPAGECALARRRSEDHRGLERRGPAGEPDPDAHQPEGRRPDHSARRRQADDADRP
jgi:hypothetical protein